MKRFENMCVRPPVRAMRRRRRRSARRPSGQCCAGRPAEAPAPPGLQTAQCALQQAALCSRQLTPWPSTQQSARCGGQTAAQRSTPPAAWATWQAGRSTPGTHAAPPRQRCCQLSRGRRRRPAACRGRLLMAPTRRQMRRQPLAVRQHHRHSRQPIAAAAATAAAAAEASFGRCSSGGAWAPSRRRGRWGRRTRRCRRRRRAAARARGKGSERLGSGRVAALSDRHEDILERPSNRCPVWSFCLPFHRLGRPDLSGNSLSPRPPDSQTTLDLKRSDSHNFST